jgi:hypothetical protein
MSDPLVIGTITVNTAGEVRPDAAAAQRGESAGTTAPNVTQGEVVAARVISAAVDGTILLEIAGKQVSASGVEGLTPGQVLALRVAAVQPALLFDILGDLGNTRLAAALRTLAGDGRQAPALWNALQGDLAKLLDLPADARPASLQPDTLAAILQRLGSLAVTRDAAATPRALETLIRGMGLDLEAVLARVASGDVAAAGEMPAGLRALLGRLSAALAADGARPLPATTAPPFAPVQQEVTLLLEQFAGKAMRVLPQPLQARLGDAMQNAARTLQTLALGPDPAGQMRAWFASIRSEVGALVRNMDPEAGAQLERDLSALIRSAEEQFARTESGRQILNQAILGGSARSVDRLRERLEALQTVNATLADRQDHLHLLFPVSILDELTEVQIKQFKHGKKGSEERGLTVVMLLELESLGRVRIDALLQKGALYCNLFVEKPDVARLVELMTPAFTDQLAARGMRLARLVCSVDARTIEKFHTLQSEPKDDEAGLIDVRI